MSSALPLIVFGQVYFLGPVGNAPFITPNSTLTPTIDEGTSQPEPLPVIKLPDYTYTPGIGAHKVHKKAAPWNTARKTCISEGGHLAIINSVEESKLIAQLFKASLPHVGSGDSDYVHIGFHDLFGEGDYVTVDGKSLESAGFKEWAGAGPNNADGNENCGSVFKDGKLNDITCSKPVGFVCELPYVEGSLIKAQ